MADGGYQYLYTVIGHSFVRFLQKFSVVYGRDNLCLDNAKVNFIGTLDAERKIAYVEDVFRYLHLYPDFISGSSVCVLDIGSNCLVSDFWMEPERLCASVYRAAQELYDHGARRVVICEILPRFDIAAVPRWQRETATEADILAAEESFFNCSELYNYLMRRRCSNPDHPITFLSHRGLQWGLRDRMGDGVHLDEEAFLPYYNSIRSAIIVQAWKQTPADLEVI